MDTPQKRKFGLITENLFFGIFVSFTFSFFIFVFGGSLWGGFVFFVFLFWRVFKGQVRWPEGPLHLALNPPYFFFVLFWFVYLLFFF